MWHKIWWCSFPLKLCRHHSTVVSIRCDSGEVWIQPNCFSSLNIRLFFLPLPQAHRSVLICLHLVAFLRKDSSLIISISFSHDMLCSQLLEYLPSFQENFLWIYWEYGLFYWILLLHLLAPQSFSDFPANSLTLLKINFAHFIQMSAIPEPCFWPVSVIVTTSKRYCF